LGHTLNIALIKVAIGTANKRPQNPQIPPKTRIASIINTGCKFTSLPNNRGNKKLPSRV
jgi:hypothetical protein